MLKLTIQKGTEVSLHDQLITQIYMQIAGGTLKEGTRLPSVRALSRQLGIHYNTCLAAYRELEQKGFIVIKRGSGAWVADLKPEHLDNDDENWGLSQLARYFVQQVYEKGYPWNDVLRAVKEANRKHLGVAQRTIVYAADQLDILPLFQAELSDTLNMNAKGVLVDTFDPKSLPEDSIYVTSRYHIRNLEARLTDSGIVPDSPILMVDVTSGAQEIELIKRLPVGELLVIISHSNTILKQAEAVVSALRGEELLMRMVHVSEGEDEIRKALSHGKLIFADYLSQPQLVEVTPKPIYPIRIIPREEMDKLQAFLKA